MILQTNYKDLKAPIEIKIGELCINLNVKNFPIYSYYRRLGESIRNVEDVLETISGEILTLQNSKIYSEKIDVKFKNLVTVTNEDRTVPVYSTILQTFSYSSLSPLRITQLIDVVGIFQNKQALTLIPTFAGIGYRFSGAYETTFFRNLQEISRSIPFPVNHILEFFISSGANSTVTYSIKELEIVIDPYPKLGETLECLNSGIRNVKHTNFIINTLQEEEFINITDSYDSYEIVCGANTEYLNINLTFLNAYKRIVIYNENATIAFNPYVKIKGEIAMSGKINSFVCIKSNSEYIILTKEINLKQVI